MKVKELAELLEDTPGLTDESDVYVAIGMVYLTLGEVKTDPDGHCILTVVSERQH